jgi:hypothetical protein
MRLQNILGIIIGLLFLEACHSIPPGSPIPLPEKSTLTATHRLEDTSPPTKTRSSLPDASASIENIPEGDLPGWRQIFSDDFADPVALGEWSDCTLEPMICGGLPITYRDRWWAFLEGWTDNGSGLNSPSRTLSVANGILDIYLHTEGGAHPVAAPVPLIHGRAGSLGQLYGRYAIRFQIDSLHGYKIAWLLWPDSETWPRDGEIDFPEGNLDANIEGYLHRQEGTAPNDADGFYSEDRMSGAWHTAVIEWKKDSVVFILDGKVIGATTDRIPNTPMHWVLEAYTALDGTVPANDPAGHVRIDWVAVYECMPVE